VTASPTLETQRFPIRLAPRPRPLLLLFGARASSAYVDLSATEIRARFGFYHLRVPLSNIERWRIEGPWLWITAIGIRRGFRDGVFTFGGTPRGGVRMDFREPVPAMRFFHVPALYVTVEDLEGLAAALTDRGIPGEDARRR